MNIIYFEFVYKILSCVQNKSISEPNKPTNKTNGKIEKLSNELIRK